MTIFIMSCHTHHEITKTPPPAKPHTEYTKVEKLNKRSPTSINTTHTNIEYNVGRKSTAVLDKYAEKLGVSRNELRNPDLYALIDQWYATPYKWGGHSTAGVDCSDFAEIVIEKIYGQKIAGPVSTLYKHCTPIKKEDLEEGDLLFFNISGPLSHVGIYLCNNKFVHASVRAGVVIEDLNLNYYKRYFYKAARLNKA